MTSNFDHPNQPLQPWTYRSQRSYVGPCDDVAVGELEQEEDGYAAPDGDVVVDCPVGGVQRNLKG